MSEKLVSACLIVKDEAENLARCLQSIRDLVDEIIVVDTGSKDNTVDIAREFKARVYVFLWNDDFSAARNFALKQATGKWVFIIDADEKIKTIKKEDWLALFNNNKKEAYFVQILNYEGQKMSVQQPALRVFRNKKGYYYQGRIHEQILPQILKKNPFSKIDYSCVVIEHDGYTSRLVNDKKKIERNIKILRLELKQHPNNSFMHFNLGNEFYRQGEYKLAIWQYKIALGCIKKGVSYYHYLILKLAMACLAGEYQQECIRVLKDGIEELPDYTDMFYLLGECYLDSGEIEKAIGMFKECLELGEPPVKYISINGVGTDKAAYRLGKSYEYMFNMDKAIEYYRLGLSKNPGNRDILQSLLNLYSKYFTEEEFEEFIQDNLSIIKEDELDFLMRKALDDFPGLVIRLYGRGVNHQSKTERSYLLSQALWNEERIDEFADLLNKLCINNYYSLKELTVLLYQYYWYLGDKEGLDDFIKNLPEQDPFKIREVHYLLNGKIAVEALSIKKPALLNLLYLFLKNYLVINYRPGIDRISNIYQGIKLPETMKVKIGKLFFKMGFWRESLDQFLKVNNEQLDEESLRYLAIIALEGDDMPTAFNFIEKGLRDREADLTTFLCYFELFLVNIMDYCRKSLEVFPDYDCFTEIEKTMQKGVDRIETFSLYDSKE